MGLIPQAVIDEFKQLWNGTADDATAFFHAQLAAVRDDLKDIRDAVDNLDAREEVFTRSARGQAVGGATSADIRLEGPRPGHMWTLTQIVTNVPGGTTSIGVVYAGDVNPVNAIQVLDEADFFTSPYMEIPIPARTPLTFALTGMPVNGSAIVVVRGKESRLPE